MVGAGVRRATVILAFLEAGFLLFASMPSSAVAADPVSCRVLVTHAVQTGEQPTVTIDKEWGLARLLLGGQYCDEPIEEWWARGLEWTVREGSLYAPQRGLVSPKEAPSITPPPNSAPKLAPKSVATPPKKTTPKPVVESKPEPKPEPASPPVPEAKEEGEQAPEPEPKPTSGGFTVQAPTKSLLKKPEPEPNESAVPEAGAETAGEETGKTIEKIGIAPNLAAEKRAIEEGNPLPSKWDQITPQEEKKSIHWAVWVAVGLGATLMMGLGIFLLLLIRKRGQAADLEDEDEDVDEEEYEEDEDL